MSGGGFRGRGFGQHGARYNNSRSGGRNDGGGSSGRSRGDNERNSRSYSRENFDNSTSSRRSGRSQNENWSSTRPFTRWDQTSNKRQSSPSSSSSTSTGHNQSSSWSRNRDEHYQNNGSLRFPYRNDSQQYYNRGGRGYFSRGGYRFSNQRGSQNFLSPYYSAPFRENIYDQYDKDSPLEEPAAPLLGSEEERQQKITEAADELKRKLLSTPATSDDIDAANWEDNNIHSQLPDDNDESNITKSLLELKHGTPGLHSTPNNLESIGALNDGNTIFPIKLFDCMQVDIDELTATTPAYDNIQDSESVNTNIIIIPTSNVDISDKGDEGINRQIFETSCTVDALNISTGPGVRGIMKSFNELVSEGSNPTAPTVVGNYSSMNNEPMQPTITDETSNSATTVAGTSNDIEIMNAEVPDLAITNSSTMESSNVTDNNQITFDMNMSSKNSTRQIPFSTNSTVHDLPKKKELNLIEYLQTQVGLSTSKSPLLSIVANEKTKDISEIINGAEKNNELFSTSSNHSQDDNSQYGGATNINHDYSEPDILRPPPLPPALPPQPSYESPELCLNAIVPEFDSIIRPSNIPSPCDTFHQSSAFNTHHATISPIMVTAPAINSSMNVTAPMSGYVMGHQSYVPITPYGPGVSLGYPSIISTLDYASAQPVPPPLPLSNSPSIQSLILQDVCASNVNEDDDVLDELKEAMEFAKQCMVMGNDDNGPEEDDIEFPTFPDLPPVMPMTMPPEKPSGVKKNLKTKKVRQGMFGAQLKAFAEAKKKNTGTNVVLETNVIEKPDETTADFPNRRKVMFNLNSKCKVLNKSDGVWLEESVVARQPGTRNKWKRLTPVPVIEKEVEKDEKSKRDCRAKKTKESEINEESEKTKETEKIKEPEKTVEPVRTRESARIRESGKNKASEKQKESEKLLKRDNKSEKNNHRRATDSNRSIDKERREAKKKFIKQPESSLSDNVAKNNQHSSPTRSRKPERTNSDEIIFISEQSSDTPSQKSSANNLSNKTTAPKSLTESTWKDRVIGRFLKMSKNDIQNMINNSSLRKFDIAMQHLVKEKKSSLSLEMRNHEDEKMKTSTYDSGDFMSQLQAILDPAATVDITDLPTNFIHQLSEVLHLDAAPVTEASSIISSEKKVESVVQSTHEPSTSTKIDPKMTSESSRLIGTNTPVMSTHDMSKSRKIDNRVSKDTVKNTSSTVLEVATCARTKVKRGQTDNANVQRNTNQVTILSAPSSSLTGNDDEMNVDELDDLIEAAVAPAKAIKTPTNNTKTTSSPSVINKSPTVVIERILLTETTATTPTTTTTTTTTSVTLQRMETPNVTRVRRQAVESEKFSNAGISKSKAVLSSMKTSTVDSTVGETLHDTPTRKLSRHEITHSDMTDNMWQRKDADDIEVCRNMTKEEYEIHYGEPPPHPSYEAEYRKIATARSRKIAANGREIVTHPMHIDGTTLCGSNSPPRVLPKSLPIQMEIGDVDSDSQCDSDTSSSSSSGSNSDTEPSLLDVTKVLKFIKQREKMAKRKTINEEIRDEVAAEIEKHRRERNVRHKSHKSRSKKRDKRKKEKKGKKKKPKKKRRHKSHHSPHPDDNTMEQDELPLRLLANDEIKREVVYDEPPKTIEDVSKYTAQPPPSRISATKISTEIVTPTLIDKFMGPEPTTSTARVLLPNITTSIVPTINSTPALITSTFKTNPISNPPSLIVTVVNTSIANANASASGVVKAALTSTVTSPLRTVTAVSLPCSTTPQSPIFQPKTKAQLKQMPEAMKTPQTTDTKITDSTIKEPKTIEPVSSTSENQIIFEPEIPSLSANVSPISTTSMTTTHTGPKKLDIKAYHERALQRKLKEEEKMKNLVANPSLLTQNLLALPLKKQLPPVDSASNCVDSESKISETDTASNSIDQLNTVAITTSSITSLSPGTKKPRRIHSKMTASLPEKNKDELNPTNLSKTTVSPARRKLDQLSASSTSATNVTMEDVNTIDNKFINIKSEGGKELKLREKVKKRPQKVAAPPSDASVHISAETTKKVTPTARNRRKDPLVPAETNENDEDVIKSADNIEVAVDKSLSSVNIPTNDAKDDHGDKNPSENIETDAVDIVQRETVPETNEHSLQIKDFIMADEKLSETIESIKNSEHINCEQTPSIQSESIEKEFNIAEKREIISTFSHHSKVSEGLISDDLPDTVAQERMTVQIISQVPKIIEDEKITEADNINVVPSESTHPDDDRITTTEYKSEVHSLIIKPELTENISICNGGLTENLDTTNNSSELLQPSAIAPDLFNHDFIDTPSLSSTSIISETNTHSSFAVSSATTGLIDSDGSISTICKSTPTHLLEPAELSHVDATISSTFPLSRDGCEKPRNYDQLTLDDLSEISMDGSILSDHKELPQTSVAATVLLSEQQNDVSMVDLLGKDALLMAEEKDHGKLAAVEDEVDNWVGRDDNVENNSIPNNVNDDESRPNNEIPISDDVSPPNDCYKEYSQQSVVLHDRVLSVEEPRNSFLDDPITFSNTKSPTPEPTEYGVLGDNDVMAESIYDDHQLEETSQDNNLDNIIPTNDETFVEHEEIPDRFENTSLDNSRPPPPISPSLSLNENIVHSSSIPDKALIKVVEGRSPERLPSPILEVSSKSIEDDQNNYRDEADNANDPDSDDKIPRVDAGKNHDHPPEDKTTGSDVESVTKNPATSEDVEHGKSSDYAVDDLCTNKLSENSNQPVIESPTSTTRIMETNSSGRDESERSSSEARSIEQDRTQCEMSFSTNITQEKSRHKRRDRDHYSSRKSSSSKSSTPTLDHKKHKRHNHDRKKHKLTLERVEEAIAANIANLVSKPTTKDDVMSRMQEIDIAIQRLMNEKMQLYQMLQTDKWPVNQGVETLIEPFKTKTKSHSLSGKNDKTLKAKEPRVLVSRLAETANAKRSTMTDTCTTKSQNSNTQKIETPKTSRTAVKSDDKRFKKLDDNLSTGSNKRKYFHAQKDSHKSKDTKRDGSPIVKKRYSLGESSRDKNKSPSRAKNSECGHRKPVKLSQMLAREFKPRVNVEKHRSVSPSADIEDIHTKLHTEDERKIAHSITNETLKPSLTDYESSDGIESSHFVPPINIPPHDDRDDAIYSDESSWDVTDHSTNKHDRSTGLSLLEQSIKREMAEKKAKSTELKVKSPSKSPKDELTFSADPDTESSQPSRLTSKRKPQRKKHQQNAVNKTATKRNNHILEVIDAVAKNRIDDLYANPKTPEKKQKTQKKNVKLLEVDKNDSGNIGSEAKVNEREASPEKTKNRPDIVKEVAQVEITISTASITPSLSPRSVSHSADEYNDATSHDAREWTTLDSIGYVDGKDESNSIQRDEELEKNEEGFNELQETSSGVANDAQRLLQTASSAIQEQSDVGCDDNMVIISSKSNENVEDKKGEGRHDMRKEILDDWQDSPNISHHELDHSHDNNTIESTKLEKIAGEVIPFLKVSTILHSDIKTEDHTLPVIETSVIVDSTRTTTIKQHASKNLEETDLVDDSITKKIGTVNSIIDKLSVKVHDSKSKRSKSVEKEVERPKSTVEELGKSKSMVKLVERPKSTVIEIERPKSTVKELERPRSTVKENDRPKSTVKEIERSKSTIETIERPRTTGKEMNRPKSTVKELDKSKSTVKETGRPKSTVKELDRSKSSVQELERSKSTIKEGEKSKSATKETEKLKSTVKEQARPKSTVKELERSKSTVEENVKPKSTVIELDKSKLTVKEPERTKSTVKEIEKSKSMVKENDRPKSAVKELERPKSTIKELDRPKSTVKEMEDMESPDHNDDEDNDDDESMNKKRGRPAKRRRQMSSRRSSKQSDDSYKTSSRSRSHSKRTTRSPSSRDGSTPDVEQRTRPNSGSSSSSIHSRRRSNTTSNIDTKTNEKNNTVRRGRKRKIPIERTREQMANCKVRLVDCKNLLQSDSRSDILQRLGISRINTWTPSVRLEPTPERPASKVSSIMVDEDRNRSDDESMEIIQVDDNMDFQSITSPESSADIMIRDPLSITPRTSPQYNLSPCNDDTTTTVDIANENEDEEDAGASSDYVEVLETRTVTPLKNPMPPDKNNDDELQTMQYTVHKGPILDIKVFGDSFLAASEDGSIYRYCQRSNGILNIYKGHEAAVTCLYVHEVPGTADSGNIRWSLFSGSLDATLRCYDIINGSLDRHIANVGSPIQCMDQAWGMIFVGTKSGHISRYDIKSGCVREDNLDFSDKPVLALRASTEGARRVLIVASRNQPITIRDAQNGLYLRTISGQRTHTVYSLMRDRNLVYCGTSSTSIPVFDFISGEQVIQYTAGVGIVCMRLYRQLLFAGCYDGNIYVFDTKDTKLICSIPGPGNMLLSMEIVDDKIIAGSKDRRLHSWRMPIQARTILADRA